MRSTRFSRWTPGLESILGRAALSLDAAELIDQVVGPLMSAIGDLWWRNQLTPGHERLATIVVRRTLDDLRATVQSETGPALVVATPSGQHHEIGAMLADAAAATAGWHVIYMGADLPATSIVTALEMTGARAVALSLIYPLRDAKLEEELRKLRRTLPDDRSILVGGQAAAGYHESLDDTSAIRLSDASGLRSALGRIGRPKSRCFRGG